MFKAIKKWWKYLGAKLGLKLEESADPKVQLEQAITEAREQHRKLTEQAANVIANQKQTQLKLDRALDEYEKANASARQALLLTDQETRAGNTEKAQSMGEAAEAFANKLISLEAQIDQMKKSLLDATQASEKAKQAVTQNSAALQKKLAEREKLLSQLDQAKMQEQMNKAMTQLSETVGDDVPTFEQVRDKIEKRLSKAQATSDLTGASVDVKMLEVEQAQASAEAQARLSELRSELGLSTPPPKEETGEAKEAGAS
ncbi:MAG TPA: PspA/IM30 family protein [Acidimicrobiia bacterium]|nr:PspA/IM30 family protein [Acidimicrobiia bacterium]